MLLMQRIRSHVLCFFLYTLIAFVSFLTLISPMRAWVLYPGKAGGGSSGAARYRSRSALRERCVYDGLKRGAAWEGHDKWKRIGPMFPERQG